MSAAESPLLDASERGDRATAQKLLAKGADVNAPGADGTTAIMYAAANDDLELVRALIKAGANVKLRNQFGTSALTEAASTPGVSRSARSIFLTHDAHVIVRTRNRALAGPMP